MNCADQINTSLMLKIPENLQLFKCMIKTIDKNGNIFGTTNLFLIVDDMMYQ